MKAKAAVGMAFRGSYAKTQPVWAGLVCPMPYLLCLRERIGTNPSLPPESLGGV